MSDRFAEGVFAGSVKGRRSVAGLVLAETEYAPGFRVEDHAHEHTILAAVLGGAFTEFRGRKSIACPAGTLVVQPPDEPHAHAFDREAGGRCFSVQFGGGWTERMGALGVGEPDRPLDLRGGKCNFLISEILREYRRDDPSGDLVVEGLALALVGEVGRSLRLRDERGARPGWLIRAVEYLHARFGEPVRMADVAASVDVHPVHLSRTFARFHGCTMGEYLRALRVEHARRLLTTTSLTLAAVALEAGFADQAHLTRVFKAATGETPGAFRRSSTEESGADDVPAAASAPSAGPSPRRGQGATRPREGRGEGAR